METKKCENCDNVHNGDYGSGRFCSNKCARGFSTKNKRDEINDKVSNTLKNKIKENGLTIQQEKELKKKEKFASYIRETDIKTLKDLTKRTISKILKRLQLSCSYCNWYVKDVVGDLHHIIHRKNGGTDNHENLTYLCPNCHRLVHNNIITDNDLINLKDYIGDEWKKYYYVKNNKIIDK